MSFDTKCSWRGDRNVRSLASWGWEVDFFEVLVDVEGTRRKAWLFLMRLMYSGRDFAWIYERQDQISFLDGHVRACAHFGGVPA